MPNVNAQIEELGSTPFPRLASLLSNITPQAGLDPIDLTIGEPRFEPPNFISDVIKQYAEDWKKYPPNDAPAWFQGSAARWMERRFNLPSKSIPDKSIVATAGAREGLFQIGFLVDKKRQYIAMPTPHYAPYRAAAVMAAGLAPFYMPSIEENGFLPDLNFIDDKLGPSIGMLMVCSPSNPEGAIASREYIQKTIELARRYDFIAVFDECYSEIYFDEPPVGAAEVAWQMRGDSRDPFANVLMINSLSKRSSAAGLRVGTVCGDQKLINALGKVRGYAAGTTPIPVLGAAAALYWDEEHVANIRAQYKRNFDIAKEVLGNTSSYKIPNAGMFLWVGVHDDEDAARILWRDAALRVVPGSYLGPPGWDGRNPGKQHIRLAMVHPPEITKMALTRLRDCFLGQELTWKGARQQLVRPSPP